MWLSILQRQPFLLHSCCCAVVAAACTASVIAGIRRVCSCQLLSLEQSVIISKRHLVHVVCACAIEALTAMAATAIPGLQHVHLCAEKQAATIANSGKVTASIVGD